MHAIRQHEFGPPTTLRWERLPDPLPVEEHVRIAVEASGVHLVDTMIRRGDAGLPFPPPPLPMTPGREVAGTVDVVGPGVDASWLGQRVVAHLGMTSGGYAERAIAPVSSLHPLGAELAADVAVAMIGTGRTAMGILDLAALESRDVVLVMAAAGGLGALFVQAGRAAGATVVGAAGGSEKVARVRALGADVAVDYRREGWVDEVRAALGGWPVTVLLDGVAGPARTQAAELMGEGARAVTYGWASGAPTALDGDALAARGITAIPAVGPGAPRRLDGQRVLEQRALDAAAAGRLAPLVESRFPLAEAARAHAALEARETVGKVVLVA